MDNVKYEVSKDGKTLVVTVDLTKDMGPSASGKTRLIASTRGALKLPGTDATLNISVYKKA